MTKRTTLIAALAATAAFTAGCGSSSSSSTAAKQTSQAKAAKPKAKENLPPGDIPDTQAFVAFAPVGGGFIVKVPEGWSRSGSGSKVTFSANLNSITVERRKGGGTVSAAAAKTTEVPAMARSFKNFKLQSIGTVKRSAGTAVRIRYLATGKPNAVTGKADTEAAERYLFSHGGSEMVLTLAGPKGADNVDPWKIVTDSLRWTK